MPTELRKQESDRWRLSETAMAQLYRGELGRSDRWRTRLDTTTNWALTTTAAVISFGFAPKSPHVTLLVGIWMVFSFLIIEARRYRYYDLWNRRLRLLEDGYWAPLLRREPVDPDALKELAREMERPQIQLSWFSAVSVRMNRAYGPILIVLVLTWFVKIYTHPEAARTFSEFVARAHVGPITGAFVLAVMVVFLVFLVLSFGMSLFARAPLGELRPRPRSRRLALWEGIYRPYDKPMPRRRNPRRSARPADSTEKPGL